MTEDGAAVRCPQCGEEDYLGPLDGYRMCYHCTVTARHLAKRLGWTTTRFVTWMQAERGQTTLAPENPWRGRGPGTGP